MDLAGLLFVALFRAVPYLCLQFWADRQDTWLCRRTWGYLTNLTLIILEPLLYFTSKDIFCRSYAIDTSAASGGLPGGLGSFGAGGTATRKPLKFCNYFLQLFFFFPPPSFCFILVFWKGIFGQQKCLSTREFSGFSGFSGSEMWNDLFIHFKRHLGMAEPIPWFGCYREVSSSVGWCGHS